MAEDAVPHLRLTGLPGMPVLRLDHVRRRATLARRDCGVTGRAFDLLSVLSETPGTPVEPLALQSRVWEGRVVVPANLRAQVRVLRRALGAAAIETLGSRGYALRAETDGAGGAGTGAPVGTAPMPEAVPFGRESDLQVLQTLLMQRRLVTLLGPVGVGKSRLARSALSALAAGTGTAVAYADMCALPSSLGAIGVMAAVLEHMHIDTCGGQPGWLLLDNAEHLAAVETDSPGPLPEVLERLAALAPGLRILITSQEPLGLPDEFTYRLAPLPLPDLRASPEQIRANPAVQLMASRAAAVHHRFSLGDDETALAARIARKLDGLPLALARAGERWPLLGAEALAERLRDPLRMLSTGAAWRPSRQANLEEAIGRSVALLPNAARTALMVLADLEASFPNARALALLQQHGMDEAQALRALEMLGDRALLLAETVDESVDMPVIDGEAVPQEGRLYRDEAGLASETSASLRRLRLLDAYRAWVLWRRTG